MGYEIPTVVYKVKLRGTQFDGVEATLSGCSSAEYLQAQRNDSTLLAAFCEHLLEWNLTNNSEPVPVTAEAVAALDAKLAMSLAVGWLREQNRTVADNPTVPLASMNGQGDQLMQTL